MARRFERDKMNALKSHVSSFPYSVSTERNPWERDLRRIYEKKKENHTLSRSPYGRLSGRFVSPNEVPRNVKFMRYTMNLRRKVRAGEQM